MLQEVVDELRDRVSSLLFLSLAIEFLKMKFLSGMCPFPHSIGIPEVEGKLWGSAV